jgi:nitroreductase/FMN reductase [NAD(P)H]
MALELQRLLAERYSDLPSEVGIGGSNATLNRMAGRGSCRSFTTQPVPLALLNTLSAVALSAPSKSDLQQRDIILITSDTSRAQLAALVGDQTWVADAPVIAVFCGNNRRQRLLHEWRGVPFANDHLDAFFNATVDAAIALGAFVTAAEALGLGCCPISAIRNEPEAVSDLLELPDHVFPIAGLAVGFPAHPTTISKRLPLRLTVHHDKYAEVGIADAISEYDQDREAAQPYANQRHTGIFGGTTNYSWSEDKIRQYSQPERTSFGDFIRGKGFNLD